MKQALAFPLLALLLTMVLLTGCHTGVTYYPEPSATSPLPTNLPKTVSLTNSTFTVSAGGYTDFPFNIEHPDENAQGVWLVSDQDGHYCGPYLG